MRTEPFVLDGLYHLRSFVANHFWAKSEQTKSAPDIPEHFRLHFVTFLEIAG